MKLTENEKQTIRQFAKSKEYEAIRKVFLAYIENITDTKTINTNRRHFEIGADIEARNQLFLRVKKFIKDLDILAQEKIKKKINFN